MGTCTGLSWGLLWCLAQSYLETGQGHTCICAHQLMCHRPGQGQGQVRHTHSREVGESNEAHERKLPTKVSFLSGINKWPLLLFKE